MHRFGGPEVLQVEDIDQSGPDASQVLVRVRAASVNPVDFKIRRGQYPAVQADRLPYTPGRDVSGIIEQCGAQATRFEVGDEIFGMVPISGGGYAEMAVLDQRAVTRKPSPIDHVAAASIPLAGQTAWQGLFRHGGLKSGQSVLIHGGSGGVGHFAIQLAKAKGARVFTTISTKNGEFARALGADTVIDYKTERFEDQVADVDIVLDLIDGETRERSWKVLRRGGILVSTLTEPSQETAARYGVRALRYTVEADGDELAEIAELVVSKKVNPHVQRTFRLDEAALAMAALEQGGAVGKVVIALK